MLSCDWSSDVCSSDLTAQLQWTKCIIPGVEATKENVYVHIVVIIAHHMNNGQLECLLNLNHHLPLWEKPQKGLVTTVIPLSLVPCASQISERAIMPSQKELSVLAIPLQLSLTQSSATTWQTLSAGPGPPKLGPKRAKPSQFPPSPSRQ